MNTETIIEKFAEQEIAFDLFRGDLMVNATEMAKPFKKRVRNWLRLNTTKALINAIKQDRKSEFKQLRYELIENEILIEKRGQHGGTFMCEDLALSFAMWLSPEFHVWILKMVREIIFGNNPELVKEAVMNMPRIQRELERLRRRRNRVRNAILGYDRRKKIEALYAERATVNFQITSLTQYSSDNPIFDQPDKLGLELVRLMKEKDAIQDRIRSTEDDYFKVLVTDEYLSLMSDVSKLEREQRHFAKAIRYSEIKTSQN